MTTHDLPPDTKPGFAEWLKYIEQEANQPAASLGAADVIKTSFIDKPKMRAA